MLDQQSDFGHLDKTRSRLAAKLGARASSLRELTSEEMNWMIHDLRTREIELETQNRELREALEELNENLEAQVAERAVVAERRAQDLRCLAAELSNAEHRERSRIVKLLHDDLQQLLLAARLRLAHVGRDGEGVADEEIERIDALLADCMDASRDLTMELSPPVLRRGKLDEVFEWLGTWFHEKYGLSVDVDAVEEVPPVPEHVRVFLFQAVREMLLNVIKHSQQMAARLALSSEDGHFTVEVEDFGSGFDPAIIEDHLQRPQTFGLFSIRERLEAMDGHLEIDASPEGGGCFRLIIPVAEPGPNLRGRAVAAEENPTSGGRFETARRQRSFRLLQSDTAGTAKDHRSTLRLFVVDDQRFVREQLVGALRTQKDFDVVGHAPFDDELIRQVVAQRPDVIIMNAELPVDGLDVVGELRRRLPEIRIFSLSIHADKPSDRSVI